MCHWGVLLSEVIQTPAEVVISGSDALVLRQELHSHYLPFMVTLGSDHKSDLPLLQGRETKLNQTQIYVCYNKTCQLPVTQVSQAIQQIKKNN